jgi:hypothetical protein
MTTPKPTTAAGAGHTPGPWRIDRTARTFIMGPSPVMSVCEVTHSGNPARTEADAALIASAPDLLAERDRLAAVNADLVAAAEKLSNWARHLQGLRLSGVEDRTLDPWTGGVSDVYAAIARATGGKS